MENKIAFFDVDGTLIDVPNGMNKPSQKTVEALKEFQRKGNLICIASARQTIPFPQDLIQFDGFIGCDGHYITFQDKVILDDLFTLSEIERQIQVFKKYNVQFNFLGHEKRWSTCWMSDLWQKHQKNYTADTSKPENLVEIFHSKDISALSCCAVFSTEKEMKKVYEELKEDFTIIAYEEEDIRIDIYRKGFKKGTAVQYMLEKLQIPKENAYAFGDGENDIEMFEHVGHGVAMENAVLSLKTKAKEHTASVHNDGVALYFEKNEL